MITFFTQSYESHASVFLVDSGGVRVYKKIQSLKDLRDKNIIKQKLDYSCGTASLATLLTFYFGQQTSEQEILDTILKDRSEEEKTIIRENGFSLLDLKMAAEALGYKAAGFQLKLEHLKKLKGPVIVYIKPRGYKHFAIFKGVRGDRVYLADPTRGHIRLSIERFSRIWDGTIFVLGNKDIEDNLTTYPLKITTGHPVQPETLNIRQMIDSSRFTY